MVRRASTTAIWSTANSTHRPRPLPRTSTSSRLAALRRFAQANLAGLQTSSTAPGNDAGSDVTRPQLGYFQQPTQLLKSSVQSQFAVNDLFDDWGSDRHADGSEIPDFDKRLDFLNEALLKAISTRTNGRSA